MIVYTGHNTVITVGGSWPRKQYALCLDLAPKAEIMLPVDNMLLTFCVHPPQIQEGAAHWYKTNLGNYHPRTLYCHTITSHILSMAGYLVSAWNRFYRLDRVTKWTIGDDFEGVGCKVS